MKEYHSFFSFFIFFAFLFSCTSRIDIVTDEAPSRICIYATISTDMKSHGVEITRTSGYFSDCPPAGVTGARVSICDGSQTTYLWESNTEGQYWTGSNFHGIEGNTYTLQVEIPARKYNEREVYQAIATMPLGFQLDSIKLEKVKLIDEFIEVRMWGDLPAQEGYYYNLHVYKNNFPPNDSLTNLRIIEDKFIKTGDVDGFPCFYISQEKDSGKLENGDVITLQVDMLDPDYGKFLSDASQEASGSFPIFSGPPANVPSNITVIEGNPQYPPVGFFAAFPSRYAFYIWYDE